MTDKLLLEQLRYWIIDRQVAVELAENHIPRAITLMKSIENEMHWLQPVI